MSNSLRSLTKNERMSELLVFFEGIAHSLIFLQKTSNLLRNPISEFPALSLSLLDFALSPQVGYNYSLTMSKKKGRGEVYKKYDLSTKNSSAQRYEPPSTFM